MTGIPTWIHDGMGASPKRCRSARDPNEQMLMVSSLSVKQQMQSSMREKSGNRSRFTSCDQLADPTSLIFGLQQNFDRHKSRLRFIYTERTESMFFLCSLSLVTMNIKLDSV